MKINLKTKVTAVFLSLLMVLTMLPLTAFAEFGISESVLNQDNLTFVSNTETQIAPGIKENKIVTNNKQGTSQVVGRAVSVDVSNPTVSIASGFADYNGNTWKMQTVRSQAQAYAKAHQDGGNIVVAVNADIYNMATGEPYNVLVMDGKIYQKGLGSPYFGITKAGKYVMGDSLDETTLNTLYQAVGGFFMIVSNGQRYGNGTVHDTNVPKTCVGMKADGSLIIYTADGRNFPISNGLDNYDLATIMMSLGCVDVINLDGGGSTTYLARYEGEEYLSLKNKPSDGVERSVSSTLFVISNARPNGEFDHASLAPNNELYTPGSTVAFTAAGVDASGAFAQLPVTGKFVLSQGSRSLGTITDSGIFTSNGTKGVVTVNYIVNEAVCGTTSIEVVDPDEVYFANEEESLGFLESSDLGLAVKYKGRDVNFKNGDFDWYVTDFKFENGAKFSYNSKTVVYTNSKLSYYTMDGTSIVVGDDLNEDEINDFCSDVLGTFDGNTFTSSDGKTVVAKVTAVYKADNKLKNSLKVIVGMLPSVVWDFEDHIVTDEFGAIIDTIPAEDYYTGSEGILTHSNYSRGGNENISIVSIDDDEPVRFGTHALRMDYDFTQCGAVTEGACVGNKVEMKIPGNPTAIGAWVYAPEGVGITYEGPGTQSGLWLRGYVQEGGGSEMGYDFTLEPKQVLNAQGEWTGIQPGVYWEGWMYCEADLTGMTGPFTIESGMTFRLMYVFGTKMGTKSAGSLYFDNLQFVYGTNVDDVENPVIDSVTANGAALKDGDVLNTNTVTFDAYFHDVENKYTTGIDPDTLRLSIDGVNTADNEYYQYVADPDGSKNHLYNVYLLDGEHSVTITARDYFGNETAETIYFTVDGEKSDIPTVSVAPLEESAVLGETVSLEVRASDSTDISKVLTGITAGSSYKDYTVTFGESFEGSYEFKKLSKTLNINAVKKNEAAGKANDLVATVTYTIPTNLTDTALFNYTVKSGSYEIGEDNYTFSQKEAVLPVTSTYIITNEPIVVGFPGTIHVEDADGNPAQGVTVYCISDEQTVVGTTDENGDIETEMFSSLAGKYVVYAMDGEGRLSFRKTIGSYASRGDDPMPYGILNNASLNPETEQSISWFSSPALSDKKQVIMYREQGTEEFTTLEAETKLNTYDKAIEGNSSSYVSNITISGLKKATAYEYKVGAGEYMSELHTFTTQGTNDNSNFFILGDIQASDMTNINAIADKLSQGDYNFGVQTGDSVDDPTSYQGWADILDIFGTEKFGDTDIIHVLGNHEYAGDATGDRAKQVFGLPESAYGSYYSVTYGDVYVAVINYAGDSNDYKKAAEWLIKDATASNAQWKILVMHQPAYYSNLDGGNGDVHAIFPKAVDKAGIDFVFSGHDHSFSRTKAMTGGELDENGAVYYICGSSGEKSYITTNRAEFNFDVCTNEYSGIMLCADVTKHEFTINAYDVSVDGTGKASYTPIDTYTKLSECMTSGHKWTYSSATDKVTCSVCGDECSDYNGFITDTVTGKNLFFTDGVKKTGWFTYLDKSYYFDENGLGVQGNKTIDGISYKFAKDGSQKYYVFHKDSDGRTRCYMGGVFITGWREIEGDLYFFTSAQGEVYGSMFTGTKTILLATGQKVQYTFTSKGALKKGSFYTFEDGNTVYYWGPTAVTGWRTIDGKQYYFSPETSYMYTGLQEINGTEYLFDETGYLYHIGDHQWQKVITITEPNCVSGGSEIQVCSLCDKIRTYKADAPGHVDEDLDGICDECGLEVGETGEIINFLNSYAIILTELLQAVIEQLKQLAGGLVKL